MAFYKLINDTLFCGPSYIHAPGYSIIATEHTKYTYPVDGWYWYDTATQAQAALLNTSAGYPATAITKLAFRNRFTTAEKAAIEIAQLDDPTATMQARSLSATLRANQADLAVALYVNLARSDTRAGVQALETYGLIGTGRAAVILDTIPAADERPI